jgi:antitoxin (DNA-binding transcriptional repressor) of toxin-antitoxin stability system
VGVIHITEAELARDLTSVIEKVRRGAEVVVESGYRSIAIIKPIKGPGRSIDECIALAKIHGSGAAMDEGFAKDLEEIVASREPFDASAWD